MASSGSGLSLHVKITVAPENADKFLEALKPAYDAVIAEPECVFFQVLHDPQQPGVFKFVEIWNCTLEWLMTVQVPKEYYKPYLAVTEPMWIKPREAEVWSTGLEGGKKWLYIGKELGSG